VTDHKEATAALRKQLLGSIVNCLQAMHTRMHTPIITTAGQRNVRRTAQVGWQTLQPASSLLACLTTTGKQASRACALPNTREVLCL
jgi:phosphopantothenoylcysteine synthetase/decarboxylase